VIDDYIIDEIRAEIPNFVLNQRYAMSLNDNISSVTQHFIRSYLDNPYIEFYFMDINAIQDEFYFYKHITSNLIVNSYSPPETTSITFLDSNSIDNLFLISGITTEKYKYKQFTDENEFFLAIPKEGRQISFDGSLCFGKIKTGVSNKGTFRIEDAQSKGPSSPFSEQLSKNSYVLIINAFTKPPNNLYIGDVCTLISFSTRPTQKILREDVINNVHEDDTFFSYDFFNDLFYNNKINIDYVNKLVFNGLFCGENVKSNLCITKPKPIPVIRPYQDDIKTMQEPICMNRFVQRAVLKHIYCPAVCKWILSVYPTITNIEKHPIFDFLLISFEDISLRFITLYGLNDNTNLNIKSISFTKTISDNTFCCAIVLHDNTHIKFEDGCCYDVSKGDVIVYHNKIPISNLLDNMVVFQIEIL
jgi:hypothetical protein